MSELVLVTYDWVPEFPRGFVRDIRARWALEEAGLPYRIATTPFRDRDSKHLEHQPFGQVPWLRHGDLSIFESGAILLHLGGLSARLLPGAPKARSEAVSWLFAALNSVEAASLPWFILIVGGEDKASPAWGRIDGFLTHRLEQTEAELAGRTWLAGEFSIADIMLADVLRLVDRFEGLSGFPGCRAYVKRATARPAFKKALTDQMAHFAAADSAGAG